ncbi:MAG TPA: hypothetical protein DCZ93_02920 [Elusimicrobia bacterium]|nr:hypothetical protein [Elusimicrobiota bacterium]
MSESRPVGSFRNSNRAGFTLPEVIIAMGLASMAFVAMLSLQTTVIAAHSRQLIAGKLAGDGVYASELFKRDIRSATAVLEPAGGDSKVLKGFINVNRLDLETPVVADKPAGYFIYCVAPGGNILYRYSGSVPVPLSFSGFNCGGAAAGNQDRQAVITASEGTTLIYSFRVRGESLNIVDMNYWILWGKEEITGSVSAQLQRGL